jgi:hypothetical protein
VSRVGITNTATWNIAENNAAASYQITTNAPAGSTIEYSLPNASNFFIINSSSGQITLINALDYEASGNPSSLTVKVDVTINGQIITETKDITINITNVSEKINITTPAHVYVSTNITTELVVQLQTSGNNDFPSISYAFNNPSVYNESYVFKREEPNWTIFEGKLFFKSLPEKFIYPISVAAYPSSASMNSSYAGTKVITVSRVGITNTATWNIAENDAYANYQITTNAPDGSTIVYSLPTVSNFFKINSSSGVIELKDALDFEASSKPSSLTVKVDVTIGTQTITATKDITINVTNVVEAPTITSASTVSFQENASINTPVYTIVVSENQVGGILTYGISGDDINLFNIVDNKVYFNESPNFESPNSTTNDNAYKIIVSATSTVGQSISTMTKDITINVTNVVEAPTITGFTSGDTKYLYSNRRQKINALLRGALNSENNVGNVTYSLANKISYIQGTSFNALSLVKINAGNTIVLARDAQSEDPSVIDFQLLATNTVNGTSLSTSYNMRLILFEITSTSTADIEENISNETIIYTINTGVAQNDLPEDCTLKYFFTTDETSLYNFDQNTGTVKLKNSPNYESRTSYAFSVYVQILKGGVIVAQTNTLPVTINVTNVAETPTITGFTSGNNINYLYKSRLGIDQIDRSQIVIHQITAGNSVGTVSYSLSSVVPNVLYIDNLNLIKFSPGEVVTNDTINFTLTATNTVNGRSLSTSYKMQLILLDITSDGTTNIDENTVAGSEVYTITTNANKVTENKTVTYGLDYNANDANFFTVDSTTGKIKIANSPNYEVKSSYTIRVSATITINNSATDFTEYKNITFNIVNLVDVPTITSASTIYFDKNITTTETVHTVKATRGTASTGSLEYSIDAVHQDGSNFIVNSTTGVVKFSSSPTKDSYIVKVIVKDSLTQDTASQVCYINVFKIEPDAFTAIENHANNSYFQVDTNLAKSDITYSITSGNTNNTFSVTKLPQDSFCKIYFVNSPNFEIPTSDAINGVYKINITATLPGSARTIPSDATLLPLQTTKEIIVNISNVVEPPIITSPNNITISYYTKLETTVYTIQATLVEKTPSDNSITYSIQDNNDSDSFICEPNTGAIKFKNSNGSNKLSYTIVVVANDFKNNISSTKSVTINIERAIHSNICFPKGTPVKTDQGEIAIDKLDSKTNTIRGRKIVAVTQTLSDEQAVICFEKDSIKQNIPSQRTVISQNHKVFYNGEMIKAKHFAEHFENVKYMDYNGETLYNVLLEEHDKMIVNNLICETLHPNNPVAQVYRALNALPENKKPEFMRQVNKHFLENPRNSVLEIMV